MPTVAIFGSAIIPSDSLEYQQSETLGRLLAENGYTVITGGHGGIMEGVSKGAYHVGGHVIGVTTDQIINQRPGLTANQWVKEEIRYPLLRDRLLHIVMNADVHIAMPGGIGTLHEIAETWELMRLKGISGHPLICFSEYWERVITPLAQSIYVDDETRSHIVFSHDPHSVVGMLNNWCENGKVTDKS